MRTARLIAAATGLVLAGWLPATVHAVRFDMAISYEFAQPWTVVPAQPNCDVRGAGIQKVTFHLHRVIQVFGESRRPNDPHPAIVADFPTPDLYQRTVSVFLTPPGDPTQPCSPFPPVRCGSRSLREVGSFRILDARRRIRLETDGGHGPLEAAQDSFDRSGSCPGPDFLVAGWWHAYLPVAWPGWRWLFRPGGRVHLAVDHTFTRVRDSGPSWSLGEYSWGARISGHVHYTLSLRNVCRTIRLPGGGRVCATGRS
jgi:hypothetical protein